MNVHPWDDVVVNAERKMNQGWQVFQQWNCQHCGAKQTMPDADKFYLFGICEECKKTTDIKKAGCNFRATYAVRPGRPMPDLT